MIALKPEPGQPRPVGDDKPKPPPPPSANPYGGPTAEQELQHPLPPRR